MTTSKRRPSPVDAPALALSAQELSLTATVATTTNGAVPAAWLTIREIGSRATPWLP